MAEKNLNDWINVRKKTGCMIVKTFAAKQTIVEEWSLVGGVIAMGQPFIGFPKRRGVHCMNLLVSNA